VLLLLPLAASLPAQPPAGAVNETQHAADLGVAIGPRLNLTLHSRGRTQPGGLGAYQLRLGPILEWTVRPSISLLGGYYHTQQQQAERDVRGTHRYFGGIELLALKKRDYELEFRSLVERFLVVGDDFTRYRNRLRLSSTRSVGPYLSGEWFADHDGLRSVRYSGGLRWRCSPRIDLDIGYFYEPRRQNLGPHRHMFLTSVHFRLNSSKRPDPDI
jgi:hypothetical protein